MEISALRTNQRIGICKILWKNVFGASNSALWIGPYVNKKTNLTYQIISDSCGYHFAFNLQELKILTNSLCANQQVIHSSCCGGMDIKIQEEHHKVIV